MVLVGVIVGVGGLLSEQRQTPAVQAIIQIKSIPVGNPNELNLVPVPVIVADKSQWSDNK